MLGYFKQLELLSNHDLSILDNTLIILCQAGFQIRYSWDSKSNHFLLDFEPLSRRKSTNPGFSNFGGSFRRVFRFKLCFSSVTDGVQLAAGPWQISGWGARKKIGGSFRRRRFDLENGAMIERSKVDERSACVVWWVLRNQFSGQLSDCRHFLILSALPIWLLSLLIVLALVSIRPFSVMAASFAHHPLVVLIVTEVARPCSNSRMQNFSSDPILILVDARDSQTHGEIYYDSRRSSKSIRTFPQTPEPSVLEARSMMEEAFPATMWILVILSFNWRNSLPKISHGGSGKCPIIFRGAMIAHSAQLESQKCSWMDLAGRRLAVPWIHEWLPWSMKPTVCNKWSWGELEDFYTYHATGARLKVKLLAPRRNCVKMLCLR